MRTAEEFENAAREHGITEWPRDPDGCSFCGYPVGYRFIDGAVYFESGCDCVRYPSPPQSRTWQDVADQYNMQDHPRVIAEMDTFWHFAPARVAEGDGK